MRPKSPSGGINVGLSEVFTNDHGNRYGKCFGELLARLSWVHKEKGEKRGRLHAIRDNDKDLSMVHAEIEHKVNSCLR
ncbi:hypothetical protein A7K93_11250 [Candidatus Methylacidiphilum fumarolicum]|nr:hypothetical protein A7K93_11250 [Candidatus Methylacidiphilum fumarolicum]